MKVPYFDLKLQYASIREEILEALDRTCRNAAFVLGEEVERFEGEFASYCGVKHCVAVNSGTSALHLALLAAGIGPGDEVVTTPNTFIATAEAISYTGARPVFADIDPRTANVDPGRIEAVLTARTKAIVPVHLYGRPAALGAILALGAKHGLPVIEDACQAHGARYAGRRVGGFGLAAAFSFYPGKNLGAYGEGGALTTNDDGVAALARMLRSHGEERRYLHDRVGYNYRMEGFQGAVLRVKMRHLDAWTARRLEIVRLYRERLAGARVVLFRDEPDSSPVHHLFVVSVDDRESVRRDLGERGVQTAVHYPIPVHRQNAYAELGYAAGSFPETERTCERVFSMPLFPEMTDDQAEFSARSLAEIVGPE
jgi:dTDP-4-amino-4,6-dideoxygalactose transaminase